MGGSLGVSTGVNPLFVTRQRVTVFTTAKYSPAAGLQFIAALLILLRKPLLCEWFLSCPPHVVVKFRYEKICRISAVRVLKIRTCAFFLVSLNLVLVVALRSN